MQTKYKRVLKLEKNPTEKKKKKKNLDRGNFINVH
jgi:hypothetical protein